MPRRRPPQPAESTIVGPPQIEMMPIRRLRLNPRNARTHSEKQIWQIAELMKRFCVINPIIADRSGTIIAGPARYQAARLLGLQSVPVIRVSHLTDAELRLYMLADNRLAESAGWDRSLLAVEFGELRIEVSQLGHRTRHHGLRAARDRRRSERSCERRSRRQRRASRDRGDRRLASW